MAHKQHSEPSEEFTKELAVGAIHRSGYLLECKVEDLLRRRDYNVVTNYPVLDYLTGKAREMDLAAFDYLTVPDESGKPAITMVRNLLIECIKPPQPLAFFTKTPQDRDDMYDYIRVMGFPTQVCLDPKERKFQFLPRYLQAHTFHHYFRGRIATQWCAFSMKKDKSAWMASHSKGGDKTEEDGEFDSITKLARATEYVIGTETVPERLKEAKGEDQLFVTFIYPVLVVQGELWEMLPHKSDQELKEVDHVKFAHQTIIKNVEFDCCIDVVRDTYLPKYLRLMKSEATKICGRLADGWPSIELTRQALKQTPNLDPELQKRLFSVEDEVD